MPGPWDGPVRVIDETVSSFRLATLDGHLEAGQIEFRASSEEADRLRFTIESWARSADRLSDFLYHRVGMARRCSSHMWISFLEGVAKLSGGRDRRRDRHRHPSHRWLRRQLRSCRRRCAVVSGACTTFRSTTTRRNWISWTRPRGGASTIAASRSSPSLRDRRSRAAAGNRRAADLGLRVRRPLFVRAFYDRDAPLLGREMVLELRALNVVSVHVEYASSGSTTRSDRSSGRSASVRALGVPDAGGPRGAGPDGLDGAQVA